MMSTLDVVVGLTVWTTSPEIYLTTLRRARLSYKLAEGHATRPSSMSPRGRCTIALLPRRRRTSHESRCLSAGTLYRPGCP
jgi:hypothetical protein